ncbi:MAG: DNA repair exonuclease [Clostridia bacterium]|nr:DNA repair exonuclease [Clostridia bacterium]
MKIIHCADLHLDSKIDIKDKAKSTLRKEEVLRSFERLCDYAKQNFVSAIIIAGDLFDGEKVSKKVLERVVVTIANYPDIDFLYLSGNHDGGANIDYSYFSKNFKVFGSEFTCFNYDGVSIGGISYQNVLTISDYESISFEKNNFNILTLHGQIVDYKGTPKNDVISLPRLKDRNINYLALGHYHSFIEGKIDLYGQYAYSGCLEGRGFDEEGEKGFVLIDTENKLVPYSFIKFCARTVHVVEYDLTPFDSWAIALSEIVRDVTSKYSKDSMIKVELVGECGTDFYLDVNQLSLKLSQNFFYVKVEDKTTLSITENDYLNDKTVRGEFISLVWNSDLSDEYKKKVITCGLNALNGEEII